MSSLDGGGAEQIMVTLANGFVDEGQAVDFVLARATGEFLKQLDPRVKVIDLERNGALQALFPLRAYLRRSRPEAMLTALSHTNVVALLASKLARVDTRMVISERTSLSGVSAHHRGIKDRTVRLLMHSAYKHADALVVVSADLAEELAVGSNIDRARIHPVPNPIVSDRLLKLAEEEPDHPWMGDLDVPVVLAVGRLAPEKDFATLIEAFAIVRAQRAVRLVILGEGPERERLEDLTEALGVQDGVALVGFKTNPFAYMRRARLFVLSSIYEGSPGALVQAMACGAQVISTDCRTGPREILQEGRWGRLVPVGDRGVMAGAMFAALDDADKPDVVKRAMDFSAQISIRRYLSILGGSPVARSVMGPALLAPNLE